MAVQTAPIQTISMQVGYTRAKRVFDILFTLLLALPLLLVSAVIAVLIMLDSRGPILFRQKRVGLNGKEFEMLKFRSMYIHQDDSTHREAIKQYIYGEKLNNEGKTPYKITQDSRITRIGRFLRKSSLDEIPQFWNVLMGEMSLVGPRPPLPYEVELYNSYAIIRLCGKPGLTGPWQVHGRSCVTFDEMVEMDISYLQQQSFWADVRFICLTIPVMIVGRGGA
ncbi:MAG TPA: sugar transferase [Ktedonobacteraceae bacterium]|nr:sugar transferase [Ktedonobacteraceae bacterium]